MVEENSIICTNCVDGMTGMDADSVDLVVTSPPFDGLRKYKGFVFDYQSVLDGLYRIMKKGGTVVWVVADATKDCDETGSSFKHALYAKEIGFKLHDTMIYMRNAVTNPSHVRYYNCFQYMFVLSKDEKPKTINLIRDHKNKTAGKSAIKRYQREKDGDLHDHRWFKASTKRPEYSVRWNVWQYDVGSLIMADDREWVGHPAVFPLGLAEDHIRSWSDEGDLVFDPMCGSGQTCIAAKKLGRKYIGMDISEEYCEMAKKRLDLYEEEPSIDQVDGQQTNPIQSHNTEISSED